MSEQNEQPDFEADLQPSNKSPTYIAFKVTQRKEGERPFWTRIGVGFLHRDGGGLNLLLDCLPLDGRITLRASPYAEDSS